MSAPVERIRTAYAAGSQVLRRAGWPVEPPEVAIAVERHRWAWRPPRVRLLLVAESHVFTSTDDVALRLREDMLPPEARRGPKVFVRHLYCLGYGEPELLSGTPMTPNPGTLQFWTLSARLAGTEGSYPHGGRRIPVQQRLAWKLQTLRRLGEQGIWLLDASLQALYFPGGASVPNGVKRPLFRIWWEHYGRWLIGDQHPAAAIWAVSKGVSEALAELRCPLQGWVYHPNAKITATVKQARWQPLLRSLDR